MPTFILDAADDQCRFPLWGEDESIGDVCGAKVAHEGDSYCAACRRLVYLPTIPRPPSPPRGEVAYCRRNDREPDVAEVFK